MKKKEERQVFDFHHFSSLFFLFFFLFSSLFSFFTPGNIYVRITIYCNSPLSPSLSSSPSLSFSLFDCDVKEQGKNGMGSKAPLSCIPGVRGEKEKWKRERKEGMRERRKKMDDEGERDRKFAPSFLSQNQSLIHSKINWIQTFFLQKSSPSLLFLSLSFFRKVLPLSSSFLSLSSEKFFPSKAIKDLESKFCSFDFLFTHKIWWSKKVVEWRFDGRE